jgi:hypothetical protein
MGTNPIQYTSRTFLTILSDINSDVELADKPEWFKRIVAGVGDVLSMMNNGVANNNYLRSAFTRRAVQELCFLIDYNIPEATTSSGEIIFYLDPDKVEFPVSISKDELVAISKGSIAIPSRRFESRNDIVYNLITLKSDNAHILNSALEVARKFSLAELVRITGDIPEGLKPGTDYYTIPVNDTHISLAVSPDDARRGKRVGLYPQVGVADISIYSVKTTCYQQEQKNNMIIGQSDGKTPWQQYDLPDENILVDTLSIQINGDIWERIDSLVFSNLFDKHYRLVWNTNRRAYIEFGNGEHGSIPSNFEIIASYAIGGGRNSNVSAIGGISSYAGTNNIINGTFNSQEMRGGADQQGIEDVKKLAPGSIRSKDRFITAEDGESLAMAHVGVSQVKCIRNAYGVLSCKIVSIAIGGGNLNESNRMELQDYLRSRTILEAIDVHVDEATIIKEDVLSNIKIISGYEWNNVMPYIRLGWKLILSETGQEILNDYLSNGIDSAIQIINQNFDEAFANSDSLQIDSMIQALQRYGARVFGDRLDESEATAFIQSTIRGIDYMETTSPIFPIILAEDEITSYGNIVLVQL